MKEVTVTFRTILPNGEAVICRAPISKEEFNKFDRNTSISDTLAGSKTSISYIDINLSDFEDDEYSDFFAEKEYYFDMKNLEAVEEAMNTVGSYPDTKEGS